MAFRRSAIPSVTIGNPDADGVGDGTTSADPLLQTNPEGALTVIDPPTLLSPPDGYRVLWSISIVTLRWQYPNTGLEFVVQVSTSPEFEGSRTDEDHETGYTLDITDLPQEDVYWRVLAYDPIHGRFSPWSEVWRWSRDAVTYPESTPGPDDGAGDEEPGPDEPGGDEGGVLDPLGVGLISIVSNPVSLGGTAVLTAQILGDHPVATWAWSVSSGGLANEDTSEATFTASTIVTDVTVTLQVTDFAGNVASGIATIRVRNVDSYQEADTVKDGCSVTMATFVKDDCTALGYGADGTSTDPVNPAFPDGGEKSDNDGKRQADLGAMCWSTDSGAWVRHYVKGYKLRLLWAESAMCGIMKVLIERLSPFADLVETMDIIYIDQSGSAPDGEGNECWALRDTEILLKGPSGTTEDAEWGRSGNTIDRYRYRVTISYHSTGANSAAYGSYFVNLIKIEWYMQYRQLIRVDSDAQWNAGTLYGATVAGNRLSGGLGSISTYLAAGSRRYLYGYAAGPYGTWAAARTATYAIYNGAAWVLGAGPYHFRVEQKIVGPPYTAEMISEAAMLRIRRSDLIVGTQAVIRVRGTIQGAANEGADNEMSLAGTTVSLRRGTPTGTGRLPGVEIASAQFRNVYEDATYKYLDIDIDADEILALPDDGGGLTNLWLHWNANKLYNWIHETEYSTGRLTFLRLRQVMSAIVGSEDWYLSDEFLLAKVLDYRGVNVADFVTTFISERGALAYEEIYWRVAVNAAGLPAANWFPTLTEALFNEQVGAVQFKVIFANVDPGWVDTVEVLVCENVQI